MPAGSYPVSEVVDERFTGEHRSFRGYLINDRDLSLGVECGGSLLSVGCFDVIVLLHMSLLLGVLSCHSVRLRLRRAYRSNTKLCKIGMSVGTNFSVETYGSAPAQVMSVNFCRDQRSTHHAPLGIRREASGCILVRPSRVWESGLV